MDWIPDDPVPITATRCPVKSTPMRPKTRLVDWPVEGLRPLKGNVIGFRQASRSHNEVLRRRFFTGVTPDPPLTLFLIISRAFNRAPKANVGAEVQPICDLIGIAQQFRLGCVALGPVPLLLQVLQIAVRVLN